LIQQLGALISLPRYNQLSHALFVELMHCAARRMPSDMQLLRLVVRAIQPATLDTV
jgi:hypothetical protein